MQKTKKVSAKPRGRKRPHELAVRSTISMPPTIFEWSQEGIRAMACPGLSAYFQALVRVDKMLRQRMAAALQSARGENDDHAQY